MRRVRTVDFVIDFVKVVVDLVLTLKQESPLTYNLGLKKHLGFKDSSVGI